MRYIHPTVWFLLIGTMVTRMASTMVMPFLAILLAQSHVSPTVIGFTIGIGALAGTLGSFIGGHLSDRLGRRPVMVASMLAWSGVFLLFYLARNPWIYIVANALNGLCRAVFEPTVQALMADLTAPEDKLAVFSYRYMAINIGSAVGPLLGAILGLTSRSLGFLPAFAVNLLYGLALLLLPLETPDLRCGTATPPSFREAVRVVGNDSALGFFIMAGLLSSLAYSQMESTLPQFLNHLFRAKGTGLYALVLGTNAVGVVILQLFVSFLMRQGQVLPAMMLGSGVMALGFVGFTLSGSAAGFLAFTLVVTLGEVLTFPLSGVLMDQLAPEDLKGTYFGAGNFRSLGSFLGPWLGGFIFKTWGGQAVFWTMAAVCLAALPIYRWAYVLKNRKVQRGMAAAVIMALILSILPLTQALAREKAPLDRPRIALALGGGAARGMSHIGVLQAFEENGIPIDMVVGTSMGSIIGGLYAAGYSPRDLRRIMFFDSGVLFDLAFPSNGGLVDTSRYEAFMDTLLGGRDFAALPVPFYAVATDLTAGQEVVLGDGAVSRAILASMSIPGLFPPVPVNGQRLADGGLRNCVPVDVARQRGGDVVIGVDITPELEGAEIHANNVVDNLRQSLYLMMNGYVDHNAPLADVMIVPEGVKSESYTEFDRVDYFIRQGYAAAERAMPQIKAAITAKDPDFPFSATASHPDHSDEELAALLDEARDTAMAAPRPFTVTSVFQPEAGSQPRLVLGLEATGGFMGRWQAGYGYLWDFAHPQADRHALALSFRLTPYLTGETSLKYYPDDASVWPGLSLSYDDYRGWAARISLDESTIGLEPRWEASIERKQALTPRLQLDGTLSAGRQPLADVKGAPAETADQDGDRLYTSGRLELTYNLVEWGWPVLEVVGTAYPQLIGQIQQVEVFTDRLNKTPASETWLGLGGAMGVKLFGLYPVRIRLLAKAPLDGGPAVWSLDLGKEVQWP